MGTPFKDAIGFEQVDRLGTRLRAAWPGFPLSRFRTLAKAGLTALELKARARHVADALEATLPGPPRRNFALLTATLGEDSGGLRLLPISEYLERHGLEDVEAALRANFDFTQHFTSEFCIRPLILSAPKQTFAALWRWVDDDNEHVRRLVSEGTRPRLPWGRQLAPFIDDPAPIFPLLERLRDDPSEYVRRSVANNLNDIAKDHPDQVLALSRRWLRGASKDRRRLVEHALRTLLKRGDARALVLVGAKASKFLKATGRLFPRKVKLGDRVTFEVALENCGRASVHAVVEARVHFVRPRGTSIKPFRVGRVDLAPLERKTISKALELKDRSIRRLFAGVHRVELQVNGVRSELGEFSLSR